MYGAMAFGLIQDMVEDQDEGKCITWLSGYANGDHDGEPTFQVYLHYTVGGGTEEVHQHGCQILKEDLPTILGVAKQFNIGFSPSLTL